MELSASEISTWTAYYSIFPFPQERADFRMARICEMLNLSAQGLGYKNKDFRLFLPNYLNDTESNELSLEQQEKADREFGDRLLAMQAKAKEA